MNSVNRKKGDDKDMVTRVFVHGLDSSSRGNKGTFFREKYPDMIIEDYPGDLENRMSKLCRILADKKDIILVGSSYGGLMAAIYACNNEDRIKRLILLAPALNLEDFSPYRSTAIKSPVILYHGSRDDIVPPDPVHDIAEEVFQNLRYNIVDDDHSLSETFTSFDWDTLLGD